MAGSWSNPGTTLIVITEELTGFSGIFGYSPSVGTGNLIFSLAAGAGTDPYGNAYPQGLDVFNPATHTRINLNDGVMLVSKDGVTTQPGSLGFNTINGNPATTLTSVLAAGVGVEGFIGLMPGSDGTEFTAPALYCAEALGTRPFYQFITGNIVKAATNLSSIESWQTPTANTGWAVGPAGGSFQPIQYRRDVQDNVHLVGVFHSTSATPAATAFTLLSGYRPVVAQRVSVNTNAGGVYAPRSLIVNTNGTVTLDPAVGATNTDVYVDVFFPLGNIS